MKRILFLVSLTVLIVGVTVGCSNVDLGATAQASAGNVEQDRTNPTSEPNQTSDEFEQIQEDIGSSLDNSNVTSWGGGDNVNTANPMSKYFGENENFPPPPFDVDIDFTLFSGAEFDDMYSEIMFMRSEEYYGKTMRLIGPYIGFYDDEAERFYHFVLVDDAAGCCFRYVEFSFSEGHIPYVYPEDYTIVDLAGVFGIYYDEVIDWDVQHLIADEIFIIEGARYVTPDWSDS